MINSSTENDTAKDDDIFETFVDRAAAEKQTLFDSRAIVGKYYEKDTLCTENELSKFRKKLNSMRTANFVKKDRSPFRRRRTAAAAGPETVANGHPSLHRTFASILNKESSAFVLATAENAVDNGEYPKWQVNYIELEHIIGPFTSVDSLRAPSPLMTTTRHPRYRHITVISDDQTSSAAVKSRRAPAKPAENPEKLRNATVVDDRTKDHCLPQRNKKPLADSGKTMNRQQQRLPADAGQKATKNVKLGLRDAKRSPLVTAKTTKIDPTGKQPMRNR